MSDKLKPIPIKDFTFEGLIERKSESFSKYFPKKTTKVVFQMPRTLPKNKKIAESQKLLRKSALQKETKSHTSFSKFAPVLAFSTVHNYLLNQRSERPSFEVASPANKYISKTSRAGETRQRPKTTLITRKPRISEVLGEVKEKKVERKLEKISVYIKVPEFDYSDYLNDLNISK